MKLFKGNCRFSAKNIETTNYIKTTLRHFYEFYDEIAACKNMSRKKSPSIL